MGREGEGAWIDREWEMGRIRFLPEGPGGKGVLSAWLELGGREMGR